MEEPEHGLLWALAKFLSDYCGEDALHRWQEKLSDAEREQLARMPDPIRETWDCVVAAMRDVVRTLATLLVHLQRVISQALASAWASIIGPDARLFGGEAF